MSSLVKALELFLDKKRAQIYDYKVSLDGQDGEIVSHARHTAQGRIDQIDQIKRVIAELRPQHPN